MSASPNAYHTARAPFGVTPDPAFLFSSDQHREALATLVWGIESDCGFAVLCAPPGLGKTTLLVNLLSQYEEKATTAFLFDVEGTGKDLLRSVAMELNLPDRHDVVLLKRDIWNACTEQALKGRRVIIVVDEAQHLEEPALESLRLLSNFETPSRKLLTIILAGQPELLATLQRPSLSQLAQRIQHIAKLRPLTPTEVAEYIQHRLRVCGYGQTRLFLPDAVSSIATLSKGVPRAINRICNHAMALSSAMNVPVIDRALISEVEHDLNSLSEQRSKPKAARASARTSVSANTDHPARAMAVGQMAFRPTIVKDQLESTGVHSSLGEKLKNRPLQIAGFWSVVAIVIGVLLVRTVLFRGGQAAASSAPVNAASVSSSGVQPQPSATDASSTAPTPKAANANLKRSAKTSKSPRRAESDESNDEEAMDMTDRLPSRVPKSDAVSVEPVAPPLVAMNANPKYLSSLVKVPEPPPNLAAPTSTTEPPTLISKSEIKYPPLALAAHVGGEVVLDLTVDDRGAVKHVSLVSGSPILATTALNSVKSWKYKPGSVDNRPVESTARVVLHFTQ